MVTINKKTSRARLRNSLALLRELGYAVEFPIEHLLICHDLFIPVDARLSKK